MNTACQDRITVLAPYLKTKKVYVYGTGEGGREVFSALNECGVNVVGFIDGNAAKISECNGLRVSAPATLEQEAPGAIAVLVASQTYLAPMQALLVKQGLVKGVNFFTPLEAASEKKKADAKNPEAKLSKTTQKYEGEFTRIFRLRDPQRGVSLTLDETYTLYQGVVATRDLPGCIAEMGVYRGGSARIICEAKGATPLYLCDTFEGMPSLQNQHDTLGVWVNTHTNTSLESVRDYVGSYPNVHFVKGIFPASLAHHAALNMETKQFRFVHLDVDLYESTLQGLEWFWPRMVPGGWLVSHNYNLTYGKWGNTPGVKKSFKEFLKGESCRIVEIAETQALIIKP